MTKELSKGFTGIEINGVRFSNIREMLIYMGKQRERIVYLEQENAKMREEVELWKKASGNNSYKAFQLEKENAEMKKQLEMSNKVYNDNLDYSHHIEGQLTNAKEIIKYLLDFIKQEGYRTRWDINIVQAEQFLSEVEK